MIRLIRYWYADQYTPNKYIILFTKLHQNWCMLPAVLSIKKYFPFMQNEHRKILRVKCSKWTVSVHLIFLPVLFSWKKLVISSLHICIIYSYTMIFFRIFRLIFHPRNWNLVTVHIVFTFIIGLSPYKSLHQIFLCYTNSSTPLPFERVSEDCVVKIVLLNFANFL